MTTRQYKRMRQWELRTKEAFDAGVMDGMDNAFVGEPRPNEILDDFDTHFYFRRLYRQTQEITNATIARNRGKIAGFDHALAEMKHADDEEWVDSMVTRGMDELEDYLRVQDRWAA